jgi:hypothetical protein
MEEALAARAYYDKEIASLEDYIKNYEQTIDAQTAQWRKQLAPAYEPRLGLLESLEANARRIASDIEARSGATLEGLNAALASDPQLAGIREHIKRVQDNLAQMRAADDARIEEGLRPYREHVANFQSRLETLRQNQSRDVNRASGRARRGSRQILDIKDDAKLARRREIARERVGDVDTVADPVLRQQASDRLADAEASQDLIAEGGSLLPKSTSAFKRIDIQKAFRDGMQALGFEDVQLPPALRNPESRSSSARPSGSSTYKVEQAQNRLASALRRQSTINENSASSMSLRRAAQRDVVKAQKEVKRLADEFLKANSPVQQRDPSASNTRRLYEAIVNPNTSPAKRLSAVEELLGTRGKRGAGAESWRPPMTDSSLPPMTAEKVLDVIRNRLSNTLPAGSPAPTNEDILTSLIREAMGGEISFTTEKGERSAIGDFGEESARAAAQSVVADLEYSRPADAAARVASARIGEYAQSAEPKGGIIRQGLSRLQELVAGRKKAPEVPDPNASDKLDVFWRMLPTEQFIDSLPASELWRAEEMIANTERMLGNATGFRDTTDPTALMEEIESLKRVLSEAVYKSKPGTPMRTAIPMGVERGVSATGKQWAPDVLKTADDLRGVQAEIMNLVRRQNTDPSVQDELGRLLGEEERLKSMLPANDVPLSPLEPRRVPPPAGSERRFEPPKIAVGGADEMAAKRAQVEPKYTFSVPSEIAGQVQEAARRNISEINFQIRDVEGGSSSSGQRVQISFDGGADPETTFEVEMIDASDTNNVAGRIGNYTLDIYPVTGKGKKKGLLEPALYNTGLTDSRQARPEGASPQQEKANAPKPPVENPPAAGQQTAEALTAAALRGEEVQVGARGEPDVVLKDAPPRAGNRKNGEKGRSKPSVAARAARVRGARKGGAAARQSSDEEFYGKAGVNRAQDQDFTYEGEPFVSDRVDGGSVEADPTGRAKTNRTEKKSGEKPAAKGVIQTLREQRLGRKGVALGAALGAGWMAKTASDGAPALADSPYVPLPAVDSGEEDTNKKREKTLSRVRGARGARGSKRYGYLTTQNPLPY